MTHRFFKSVLCSLTIMLLCACPKAPEPKNENENLPAPPTKVLDYLSLSVQYMMNQQKNDGFFNYEYNFITGNYTNWDNVIHQTRAGYVLAKYYSFLIEQSYIKSSAGRSRRGSRRARKRCKSFKRLCLSLFVPSKYARSADLVLL